MKKIFKEYFDEVIKDQIEQRSTKKSRATGITTRLIDVVIQKLFLEDEVELNHEWFFNSYELKYLIDSIETRLTIEHRRIKLQHKAIKIEGKLYTRLKLERNERRFSKTEKTA